MEDDGCMMQDRLGASMIPRLKGNASITQNPPRASTMPDSKGLVDGGHLQVHASSMPKLQIDGVKNICNTIEIRNKEKTQQRKYLLVSSLLDWQSDGSEMGQLMMWAPTMPDSQSLSGGGSFTDLCFIHAEIANRRREEYL